MIDRYEDILHMPHHVSPNRPRMSMLDRAAQFSPFAALSGYEAAIQETGRLTDSQVELEPDEAAVLDEKIRLLQHRQEEQPEITLIYFVPDERKPGGAYARITGRVSRIDPQKQTIRMTDGTAVSFRQLRTIEGALFGPDEGR